MAEVIGGALDATTGTIAGTADFDIFGALNQVAASVGTVSRSVLEFQQQRDSLATTREDRALQSYIRASEMALARDKVAIQSDIERTKAQVMLAEAQAKLQGYLPSATGQNIGLALTVLGVVIGAWAIFKK